LDNLPREHLKHNLARDRIRGRCGGVPRLGGEAKTGFVRNEQRRAEAGGGAKHPYPENNLAKDIEAGPHETSLDKRIHYE